MAQNPSYEVPPQMRDFAATSLEQARNAFGSFIGVTRRAADSMQGSADLARTGAQALYARGLDYAEQNVRAALDHARKLAGARSLPEATQIQADYARERFAALQAQAREMSGLAQGAFRQGAEQARAALQQGAEAASRTAEQGREAAAEAAASVQQTVEETAH
jgi:phasin